MNVSGILTLRNKIDRKRKAIAVLKNYNTGLKPLKRSALESTKTLDIAIAAADSIGDNWTPQTG